MPSPLTSSIHGMRGGGSPMGPMPGHHRVGPSLMLCSHALAHQYCTLQGHLCFTPLLWCQALP